MEKNKLIIEAASNFLSDQSEYGINNLYDAYVILQTASEEGMGDKLAADYVNVMDSLGYVTVDNLLDMIDAGVILLKNQRNEFNSDDDFLGFQVLDDDNNIHPDMEGSFCVYSYSQAMHMINKSDRKRMWKLLPIYKGDIEEPTIRYDGNPHK